MLAPHRVERAVILVTHKGKRDANAWIASPTKGVVSFPGQRGFLAACDVTWEGREYANDPMTPAQLAAARVLIDQGDELRRVLADELSADQRRAGEVDEGEVWSSDELLERLELEQIELLSRAKAGLAYTRLAFDGAWRRGGMTVFLHGTRVVAIGNYDLELRDRGAKKVQAPPAERTADNARVAASWLTAPSAAVVALPMWRGYRDRWSIAFVDGGDRMDDDPLEPTSSQIEACERLVQAGDPIREALLGALFESYAGAVAAPRPVRTKGGLKAVVRARKLRVHAEDLDGLAYTEFTVAAPWVRSGLLRVLMHGDRVVGLTTSKTYAAAIADDQEEHLRAARAAKLKSKPRARRAPRR